MKWTRLLFILIVLAVGSAARAQVTAQITDAGGQSWNNGTWNVDLEPAPGSQLTGPFNLISNGSPVVNQHQSGVLDASGNLSVTITPNNQIAPTNTNWRFQVCPNASSNCFIAFVLITSSSQVVSSSLVPPAIVINAAIPLPSIRAYADVEIINPTVGQQYFNVTANSIRFWNGSAWQIVAPSGGGGLPAGTVAGQNIVCNASPCATNGAWATSQLVLGNGGAPVTSAYTLALGGTSTTGDNQKVIRIGSGGSLNAIPCSTGTNVAGSVFRVENNSGVLQLLSVTTSSCSDSFLNYTAPGLPTTGTTLNLGTGQTVTISNSAGTVWTVNGPQITYTFVQNFYLCVGSLTNCAYNGDGGQTATPSDSNLCTTKALPCATVAGVAARIGTGTVNSNTVYNVQVTLNVADTTGGTCFRPQNVVMDGVSTGVGDNTVLQTLYGGTETYPGGMLTILGHTSSPSSVKLVGATTCGGTTPATTFGIIFRGMSVRITGIEADYYAGTSPANGAAFVAEGGGSTLYLDHENSTSNSTGYVVIGANGAHVKLGPALTWANVNGMSLQSEASADTHTPAGDCTLVYSNSGSGNAFDIDEGFTHFILDGFDGTFNMSFSGGGAYNVFLVNEGHIGFFGDHAMAFTFNAAAATEITVNPGEFGWEASVAESIGNGNVTGTFTALAKRVNVVGYGLVRTGPTTCSCDSASTVTSGYWIQNGVINAGGVYEQNYSAAGVITKVRHSVTDSITLSSGTGTKTFTGSAVFGGQFSFACYGYDVTTPANTNTTRVIPASASSVTVTGTGSDLIFFTCDGT